MVGTRKVQHIVLLSPSVDLMSMVMLLSSGPPVVSQHHRRGSVIVLSRSTKSDAVCQVLVSISTLYGVLVLYVLLVMILCVRIYFNGVLVPSLCLLLCAVLCCLSAALSVSSI